MTITTPGKFEGEPEYIRDHTMTINESVLAHAKSLQNVPLWSDAFGAKDMRSWYEQARAYPTSDNGDIALVRAWLAYHRGLITAALATVSRSRGRTIKINASGAWERVRITDPYDHRNGVVPIAR